MCRRMRCTTMADHRSSVHTSAPASGAAGFVATIAGLLLLIVALLLLDTMLAAIDARESRVHAHNLYEEGRALLASHQAHEASDRFASAVAMERTNTSYSLGLAESMLADHRPDEAERTLDALLDRAENDGSVNLVKARMLAAQNRGSDAIVYYHRAIYGRWGADSARRRTAARFELVELLANRRDESAMLSELLPLEAKYPDSVEIRRRLAHLFVRAGAPSRGADIFREFLHANPRDADAYAGMGEAALALGNFSTARADLSQAARLRPTDNALAAQLALADSVVALNPILRGLSAEDRFTRARSLLARAVLEVSRCAGPAGAPIALADSAQVALTATVRPRAQRDAAERLTELAGDVWSQRPAQCVAGVVPDQPLAMLLGALEQ